MCYIGCIAWYTYSIGETQKRNENLMSLFCGVFLAGFTVAFFWGLPIDANALVVVAAMLTIAGAFIGIPIGVVLKQKSREALWKEQDELYEPELPPLRQEKTILRRGDDDKYV
jgi:hypothetical protein